VIVTPEDIERSIESKVELVRRGRVAAFTVELDTSVVSRHYGEALAAAGEYDTHASAVTAVLAKRRRPKGKKASDFELPIRYHVDVDEV
jgi:hypothetical protein